MPRSTDIEFPGALKPSVAQKWIVEQLALGPTPHVSRLAKGMGQRIEAGDRSMNWLEGEIVEDFRRSAFSDL